MDEPVARPGTVVVVGSLNADLAVRTATLPRPGETVIGGELAVTPGGKSANQAVAIGRLGGSVRLLGRVGDDPHGDLLVRQARTAGVDVDAVRRLAGTATGTAVILVDDEAQNVIVVSPGANALLTAADLRAAGCFFEGADVVCLCLEVPLDAVQMAARSATDVGARVLLNLSPYRSVPAELLALVDVLLVNEHELGQLLTDRCDPATRPAADAGSLESMLLRATAAPAAPEWLDAVGVRSTVVTLGARGSIVLERGRPPTRIDPIPVTALDTTGCGDAFTGALAMRLAQGATLVDAARYAARVGAYAATGHGAQTSYPSAADLLQPVAGWGR